jgi:hypothetical protein
MIDPQCIKIESGRPLQTIAYTADGYLLPCCWCDSLYTRSDIEKLNLFNENLKLQNVKSIEEILYSDTWKKFFNIITFDIDNAPICCKKKCSVSNDT